MKRLRKAFGSFKNLAKSQREDEETQHSSSKRNLGVYGSETSSLTSNSHQELSYVSYDDQSLDSYRTSLFAHQGIALGQSIQGLTKLHQCAYSGNLSRVKKALKKASVNARDGNGRTALHMAAAAGHTGVILLLLGSMADLEIEDKDGNTPFLTSVEKNHISAAHLLLQSKVNIEAHDNSENTALHLAARSGSKEILELILDQGLDFNAINALGQSPLHIATSELNIEAVKILIQYGADVNSRDKEEVTPLMVAAKLGFRPLIDFLINVGADVDAVDRSQWNAAAYAKYNMYEDLSQQLLALSKQSDKSKPLFGFGGAMPELRQEPDLASIKSDVTLDSWKDDSDTSQQSKPKIPSVLFQVTILDEEDDRAQAPVENDENAGPKFKVMQKELSTSSSSLGPPKPPRLFASTPNLANETRGILGEATSTPDLRESFPPEKIEAQDEADSLGTQMDSWSHNSKMASVQPEAASDPVAEDDTNPPFNDDVEEDDDDEFDDSSNAVLPLGDWEDDFISASKAVKSIPKEINDKNPSGVNEEKIIPSLDVETNNQPETDCLIDPNRGTSDPLHFVRSDFDRNVIPNLELSQQSSLESDKEESLSLNEEKHGIEGTLGRQGTLQEIEEMWESNAKIGGSFDLSDKSHSSQSVSHLGDETENNSNSADLRKVFFGDSTENVFNIQGNSKGSLERANNTAGNSCSKPASMEESKLHSDSLTSGSLKMESDGDFEEKINDQGLIDSTVLSSHIVASNDDLLNLVRELRISLNRETARRKSSIRKLSQMKKIETDLKQQLRDAESVAFHYKNEASILGSKLVQAEFQASGSLDDSKFALSSLDEAQKTIGALEDEKRLLSAEVIDKAVYLDNLQKECETNRQMNSALKEKFETIAIRSSQSVVVQTHDPNAGLSSKEVQTVDDKNMPSDMKESISDTLTQMEFILCDASTQIEKIIEKENVSLEIVPKTEADKESPLQVGIISDEKSNVPEKNKPTLSDAAIQVDYPIIEPEEKICIDVFAQTESLDIPYEHIKERHFSPPITNSISSQTEDDRECLDLVPVIDESKISKIHHADIASLLKSIVKDSNEDMKNVFNSSVKEALKENDDQSPKQDYNKFESNLRELPEIICTKLTSEITNLIPKDEAILKTSFDGMNGKLKALQEILHLVQEMKASISDEAVNISHCIALNKANGELMNKVRNDLNALPKDISATWLDHDRRMKDEISRKFEENELLLQRIWKWIEENSASFDNVFSQLDATNIKTNESEFQALDERRNIIKETLSSEFICVKESIVGCEQTVKEFLNRIKCNLEDSQVQLNQSINSTIKHLLNNMDETVEENFQIVQNFLQNLHQNLIERVNEMRMDKAKEAEELGAQLKTISADLEETKKTLSNLRVSLDVCQEFHSRPALDETLIKAIHGNHDQALSAIQSQNQALLNSFSKVDKQLNDIIERTNKFEEIPLTSKGFEEISQCLKSSFMQNCLQLNNLGSEISSIKNQNKDIIHSLNSLNNTISESNADKVWKTKLSNIESQNLVLLQENTKLSFLIGEYKKEIDDSKHHNPSFRNLQHKEFVTSDSQILQDSQNCKPPISSRNNETESLINRQANLTKDINNQLPTVDDTASKIHNTLNQIEAAEESSYSKEADQLQQSLDSAIADASFIKREKKHLEKELKEKNKIIKELQTQIVDLESDQSEMESELNMKNSHVILLKKESASHLKKLREAKEQLDEYTLVKGKTSKLEQKCREMEMDLNLKQSLIESLQERADALSKEKLNLLNEVSQLKESKLASQILTKEKEMAEESAKSLERELKEIYEKLSYEYVPKSKIETLYSQIDSHFQILMSNKLKELNELLEEKYRSNSLKEKQKLSQEDLQEEIVKLQSEVRGLKTSLHQMPNQGSEMWHKQYNLLYQKYQKLLEESENNFGNTSKDNHVTLPPQSKGENIEDTIRNIEAFLKRPYPRSKFLADLSSPQTASPPAWNSSFATCSEHLDQPSNLKTKRGGKDLFVFSENDINSPRYSIMKAERDYGVDGSYLSPSEISFVEQTDGSHLNQSIENYVDLLKSNYQ